MGNQPTGVKASEFIGYCPFDVAKKVGSCLLYTSGKIGVRFVSKGELE